MFVMFVLVGIKDFVINLLVFILVEVDIFSEVFLGQEMCMNEEFNFKDIVVFFICMEVDDYYLDVLVLLIKDKNVIELNGVFLFGDLKEGDKFLFGIGFFILGIFYLNFQLMGNLNNVIDGSSFRGLEFERFGINEDLDSFSRIS